MAGRRRPDGTPPHELGEGEYCYYKGEWWCVPPGHPRFLGALRNHQVTLHEDGTITVEPSILITVGPPEARESWHGFLRAGTWEIA